MYVEDEIDVIEVWKGNRSLAYLFIYCKLHLAEIAKCQVNESIQLKTYRVSPDGLLQPGTLMSADIEYGTTKRNTALIKERQAAEHESKLRAEFDKSDDSLLARVKKRLLCTKPH